MVKLNKRGYMQTLEAVIALMILLGVIIFSISLREPENQKLPEDIRLTQDAILGGLQYDVAVRNLILKAGGLDLSAITIYAGLIDSVPEGIKMGFAVDDDLFKFPFDLHKNKQNIYADSVILAGESGEVRKFTLYLWYLDEELTSPCPIGYVSLSSCTTAYNCINELNTTIGNATAMEHILNDFSFGCDAGSCTMQPYTC